MVLFGIKVVFMNFIRVEYEKCNWYNLFWNIFSSTGEANVGYHNELYPCTFYQLINEWRRNWASNSNTNPNFPFGFVQLSTKGPIDPTPLIRWHQTYDFGYVPNEIMQVYIHLFIWIFLVFTIIIHICIVWNVS